METSSATLGMTFLNQFKVFGIETVPQFLNFREKKLRFR